jgi:hypothetical protein
VIEGLLHAWAMSHSGLPGFLVLLAVLLDCFNTDMSVRPSAGLDDQQAFPFCAGLRKLRPNPANNSE